MALNEPKDWTDLKVVIQYVETLGPGKTVFKETGNPCYGVCETTNIRKSGSQTGNYIASRPGVIWDLDDDGNKVNFRNVGGELIKPQRRFIIYQTK